MTRAAANAYATIGVAIIVFWVLFVAFGVPAFGRFIGAATGAPSICAGLNAWDCAARAEVR